MAADICKFVMNSALFAGTVFKGVGTRPRLSGAVKILHFAQSAGNLSTQVGSSSETTRVDSSEAFNDCFAKIFDRAGYFSVHSGTPGVQLILAQKTAFSLEIQKRFGAVFKTTIEGLYWRTTDRQTVISVVAAVNGRLRVERRHKQLVGVCVALGLSAKRPAG